MPGARCLPKATRIAAHTRHSNGYYLNVTATSRRSTILDDMYRAKGKGSILVTHPARERGPVRIVLAELFAGGECAPCVSRPGVRRHGRALRFRRGRADLPRTFPPDPMTNPDTQARAKYCGVNATPTCSLTASRSNPAAAANRSRKRRLPDAGLIEAAGDRAGGVARWPRPASPATRSGVGEANCCRAADRAGRSRCTSRWPGTTR